MEKRILIIDDDKDILEALRDLLELEGYKVSINSGDDRILEVVRSFRPHVILLDLLLSGKDGATICKKIRSTSDTPDIPVIIMSAHPYAQKTIAGCGANDFLRKPFDIDQLLSVLHAYIPDS